MDTNRALLAIAISFAILFGYQFFFMQTPEEKLSQAPQTATPSAADTGKIPLPELPASSRAAAPPLPRGRDITLDTGLYTAVFSETGGALKSFRLKGYRESIEADAGSQELVTTSHPRELPLQFAWGAEPDAMPVPFFKSNTDALALSTAGGKALGTITMQARLENGLEMTRIIEAKDNDYRLRLTVNVHNTTDKDLQGAPFLFSMHQPFASEGKGGDTVFAGPTALVDAKVVQATPKDLGKEGPRDLAGNISWVAYEGTYFIDAVLPEEQKTARQARFSVRDGKVGILLGAAAEVIPARGFRQYHYTLYFGPKKMDVLKSYGGGLEKALDFGWFDPIAKPTLILLNGIHSFVPNYGLAIICVTVLIKLLFWPISQKGLKSMKNMQKLQPRILKLKERYKDDPARMNQEMMTLYKTYKVNPLGGCLPMILQIPVFFALYKVLLQAIELRHAPFALWITDLSAPDRLGIGFPVPWLGGVPVLTLLMGASMFVQQKMTPSTADPAQAKVMMFLPVIFTFMFINFSSGLVLYWFVNNLLSILQQYLINRQQQTE